MFENFIVFVFFSMKSLQGLFFVTVLFSETAHWIKDFKDVMLTSSRPLRSQGENSLNSLKSFSETPNHPRASVIHQLAPFSNVSTTFYINYSFKNIFNRFWSCWHRNFPWLHSWSSNLLDGLCLETYEHRIILLTC